MSKSKSKFQLNATTVRIMLGAGLGISTLVGVAGFIGMNTFIQKQVDELAARKQDMKASTNTISSLQAAKQKIESNRDTIAKSSLLRDSGQFPEFAIIEKVSTLASESGISSISYDYGTSGEADTTTQGNDTSATQPTAPPAAASGKTISITATFGASVSYNKLLHFLSSIETSLPRLQAKGVSIAPDGNSSSKVTVEPMTIEMFIE